ncbi:hypothetical protein [Wenxinia saemankumensis]|uniref:Uncharacterized protein n=1 Tax=Wenxinia saemankumensis TaxID=1447782 RepID=A0A1M6E291_9RHOB|nr:hypothetical protein [Wenxinia saemankumensis]SHI79490.1 hypothetical protein SAMN05444417_1751 [Wenxinia saemankumensis]
MASSLDVRADPAPPPCAVVDLVHAEVMRIEPARLTRLAAERGTRPAREELRRLRTVLVRSRLRIWAALEAGEVRDVARQAVALSDVAADLGLPCLREAALNLADCVGGRDPTAIAATSARLSRLCRAALAGLPPGLGLTGQI